jgi:hypothetical protein
MQALVVTLAGAIDRFRYGSNVGSLRQPMQIKYEKHTATVLGFIFHGLLKNIINFFTSVVNIFFVFGGFTKKYLNNNYNA